MTDCYKAMVGLRVVRRFTDEPIPDDVLAAILEAARWTGSAKNRQDWRFILLTSPERRAEVATAGDYTAPLRAAREAIVLVNTPGGYPFDVGRAAQNIMLAASFYGVGSCPVTLHREDDAKRILGVPADHSARYAIALGYPDVEAEREARRRSTTGGRMTLDRLVMPDRFTG